MHELHDEKTFGVDAEERQGSTRKLLGGRLGLPLTCRGPTSVGGTHRDQTSMNG